MKNKIIVNVRMETPSLVEPGIKTFSIKALRECHQFKQKHYNTIFNICAGLVLIVILGILLYLKYKGKMTPEEKKKHENKKKRIYFVTNTKFQRGKRKNASDFNNWIAWVEYLKPFFEF